MKIPTFFISLIIFYSIFIGPVMSSDLKIHFAGFSFRGNYAQVNNNYPTTLLISNQKSKDQRSVLDAELCDRINNIDIKGGDIVSTESTEMADLGDGSIVLSCCLDTEFVSIEKFDDGYKLVIDLGAQALFFDYSNMKIVASYPVMVELIDYLPNEPDRRVIQDRIRDLLLTQNYGLNLLDDFISILQKIEIKKSYGSAMKVTDVIIEDKAFSHLPPRFKNDPANFKTFVAQNFGKFISNNQGVSILPYTKGSDIGNKMAVRFSDARVYDLEIPEPQFSIELTVRGFKKVCTDQKASGACWVYGSFARIKVHQPMLGKIYMDDKVKQGVSKIVPSTQKTVNDWPSFQNSLLALFNDTSKKLSTDKKYKDVRKVIEKCK
jgi:hypothetical protein